MGGKLPALPRKNKRTESKLDSRVAKWFEKEWPLSVLLEVKMLNGKLSEHQQRLIDKVTRDRKFSYKFPDGGRRTPLDYVIVKNCDTALCYCDDTGHCECSVNKEHSFTIKV